MTVAPIIDHRTEIHPLGNRRVFVIMSLMDKLTSRHHWVSQFLLRKFRIPGVPGERIYRYQRNSGQPGISKPIREVAQQRGFNTLSSTDGSVESAGLEDIFGKLETLAAPVIEKLQSEDMNLSDEERNNLASYIGILASANPKNRRLFQILLERPEEIVAFMQENRERIIDGFVTARPDLPNAREDMGNYIDNAEKSVEALNENPKLLFAFTSFHNGSTRAEELLERKWVLTTTDAPNFFVVSDHPVIAIPPTDNPSEWVDKYWNLPLALPISPYKALHLIGRDSPVAEVVKIDAQGVARVNKYSMVFAEDEIYSHSTSEEVRKAFASTKKDDSDRFFIQ